MSQNEDELLDLMAVAKKQLAIVQTATQAMQTQRGELCDAIAQLKNMRATVAAEAKKGAEAGLQGMSSKAITALDDEVGKAKQAIGDAAESLRIRAFAKSLKWICGCLIVGFLMGMVVSWLMWGRNARAAVDRFDSINAALERQLDKKTPAPPMPARPHKQAGQKQRQQDSAPSPVPQEQP